MHWSSLALHEELATIYNRYRGVTAPANALTTSLWNKIEEVEGIERASRR